MTDESQWQAAVQAAEDRYGKLDILVNNAGILIRKGLEETTVEDWDRIMDVNAKGVFLGTKSAIPAMRRAGGGSIVNISSTAGLVGSPDGSPVTRPPKARSGSLPRRPRCSTHGKTFVATRCILVP